LTEPAERIVRFGPGDRLLGVVTAAAPTLPDAPACLLFNAGVVHRIGPHRINVKLARALAQRGFTSLRMDLAGLGDSPVAAEAGNVNSSDQAMADLRMAMDHLESTEGVRRFVLFGLCSGARHSYRLAQIDERVVGLLMFDGYVYPTLKTQFVRRRARLRALSWSALLRKPIDWVVHKARMRPANQAATDEPTQPSAQEFRVVMDALVARGTAVYTLHSGSFIASYNYADQWRDKFRGASFLKHSRHDYLPDLDHTLSSVPAQRKLIALVSDWAQGLFAGSGNNGSSTQDKLAPP
jgi:pimeloyl-ACP methyl ester carboxylesterase